MSHTCVWSVFGGCPPLTTPFPSGALVVQWATIERKVQWGRLPVLDCPLVFTVAPIPLSSLSISAQQTTCTPEGWGSGHGGALVVCTSHTDLLLCWRTGLGCDMGPTDVPPCCCPGLWPIFGSMVVQWSAPLRHSKKLLGSWLRNLHLLPRLTWVSAW